jgi:hypothetical protein
LRLPLPAGFSHVDHQRSASSDRKDAVMTLSRPSEQKLRATLDPEAVAT